MKKIRVAVVGVGHLGRFHAAKFAEMEKAELYGVADLQKDRAQEIAAKYGVRWTTDFREFLPKVEALSIVTPTVTHYQIAKEALEAGKHLFVEKPLTDHPSTAQDLVERARKKGCLLQVGHIERFQPSVKRLLSEAKRPLFIEAHRLSGFSPRALDVDVILDLMIHDLDLVLALNPGVKVKTFLASGAPVLSDKLDIASVRLVLENHCSANLTASRISLTPQRRFRVFEKGAYFSVDTLERKYFQVRLQAGRLLPQEEHFPQADPLKEELETFVEAILKGQSPPVGGAEALEALRLAFQIKDHIQETLGKIFP